MRSSTLQFVVAGALVAAWAWMLGRPLLTNLFRRSRRDSVGHFRYQQAVLSQPAGYEPSGGRRWSDRPRPIRSWKNQPVERRRLQTMLGFALATFFSALLAIALRGAFINLLLVMAGCFVVYVCVAASIGSRQLRAAETHRRRQVVAEMAEPAAEPLVTTDQSPSERIAPVERSVLFPDPLPEPVAESETLSNAEEADLAAEYAGFGTGEFDDDFFEPIPGLTFEPLHLDSSVLRGEDDGQRTLFGSENAGPGNLLADDFSDQFSDLIGAGEHADQHSLGRDRSGDFFSEDQLLDEGSEEQESNRPTFTTPVRRQPQRPVKRNKARPIYIESQLDEGDEQTKAVND